MSKKAIFLLALLPSFSMATTIADYSFKSPSLNGSGYGAFQMAIENEQYTRQQQIQQAIQAAADAKAAAAQNTPLAMFLTNLESRIYAQISQNVATSMFSSSGAPQSGSINFGGSIITWEPTTLPATVVGGNTIPGGQGIKMTIIDPTGNTSVINVPLGQFVVP
jgi:hypothetical protein